MKTLLQQPLEMFKNKNLLALLFLLSFIGKSQINPAWVKFSGPSNYANYDVREVSVGADTLGNIYTAASMEDTINNLDKIMLVKYNSSGTQQWIQYFTSGTNSSYAVNLLVDKAGNSYLCGYGYHNNTSSSDFMVLKYNNAGAQQWAQYFDGGQNERDYITCANFDAAGNIVVAGYVNFQGTNWDDLAVVKWSTAGTQLWSYIYNNSSVNGEDRALAIASDPSSNIYVTGSSMGTVHRDMIVLKLNSSGANQWTNRLTHMTAGEDEKGYSIVADASGNSYVTGELSDWVTIKYNSSGTVQWTNHYTTGALNRGNLKKVMLDKANNVVVTGDAFFTGGHFTDLAAFKLNNATGVSLWSSNVDMNGSDIFSDAVLDTNLTLFMTARVEGSNGDDIGTVGLSGSGAAFWSAHYSNPSNTSGRDQAYQIILDKNRNVILAGVAETRGSGSGSAVDVITLKYSALVTGIKEENLNTVNIQLYPNPTKEVLTLSHTETKLLGSKVVISNLLGEIIKTELVKEYSLQLNVSDLPNGVYLIQMRNNNSVASGKFIKE